MYGLSDHLNGMPETRLRALRQASSRYSIPTVRSIEHTFVRGVERITLPLPSGPKHVHCYVLAGDDGPILVDAGIGGQDDWPEVGAVVITHMHPDHVGGAEAARDATGAPVHQGALDYAQCERVWGSADWPERIAAWFASNGVPRASTEQLIEQGHAFRPFIRFVRHPQLLYEGSDVGGWRVLELPGHADGHIALERDGVLVAGDTLLAPISPAVGLYPESKPDPLGDYVATLRRIVELAPSVVYPGHGEPIEDPAGRARELLEHHAERLAATQAALAAEAEPRTGFDLSHALFPGADRPTQRRFAVAETLSHLERLVAEGLARRGFDGRVVTYTGP
jgi:glyoxylase-like metal-dependent hydrolase (beta-lactamase superfamily II)